jgi:hypothetical protein
VDAIALSFFALRWGLANIFPRVGLEAESSRSQIPKNLGKQM